MHGEQSDAGCNYTVVRDHLLPQVVAGAEKRAQLLAQERAASRRPGGPGRVLSPILESKVDWKVLEQGGQYGSGYRLLASSTLDALRGRQIWDLFDQHLDLFDQAVAVLINDWTDSIKHWTL